MVQIILIGLAGSIGAAIRYLLGRLVTKRMRSHIPFATLLINVSGSFLIGLLFVAALRHRISSTLQTTLATGFLGGYTTFSTMSWEGLQLIREGNARASFVYLGGTVALGLFAVVIGFALGWII